MACHDGHSPAHQVRDQTRGLGIVEDHDVELEELLLRLLFAGKELNIVDDQKIDLPVEKREIG